METTKEIYEAPLCTVIEVDAQEVICTSGTHQGFEEDDYHGGLDRHGIRLLRGRTGRQHTTLRQSANGVLRQH